MHIAVVGAGLSGLTAARQLQAQGHVVTVYEKSMGVSGRMSTRQTELGGFDHGAQYFTASSERFKKEVNDWKKLGWVAQWDEKLVKLDHAVSKAAGQSGKRYVAVPGMSALGKQLAHGLDVRKEQQVTSLEAYGTQWLLNIKSDAVAIAASAGPFDAVILAVPADQAAPLLAPLPAFAAQAEAAKLAPCWTLMLGFQTSLELPYGGAWVEQSRLAWIARDTSKPLHRVGERWVAQATPAWSLEHLEEDPERAKEKLLKAFHEATGSWIQPIHAVVHRWRFAQAEHPVAADCLWDGKQGIGVCGDWFAAGLEGGGRVENAFLSALALAQQLP
ncbi:MULTISPECIES: NAD(P)/FAD-dependent oxidoreductase [unclassified Undibacterium]|uniref:NAD(P)/FAD-dependent oxidoreductase n=1 Tax=unclassified Undibacterium TaxID=2630295 RepID=UPI002AC98FE7|nr:MULTISPECIES: FAD-dependent oxidoreductase [unclassified Undibacterium]MEB0139149.1 FAD-dependent oxidoreductase [Undibacterium sp. CCC2.1]MEB0172871.1 FAD-dependent oxidoreductase [Undibacterium sp. CCC1.1]MEB0176657.1 FAD-dependent oxidoreductase [Undibacterium sp. CCC3.4]MEB0216015.1 FAD-dependent oxidoreductase [Undibacterium sp. 5I2]WPX43143.1 FAD-dependent oxidoreductase [Undibacterium sp. CCC3.4]